MTIQEEILEASYWEHYKAAKDMSLWLPLKHPKRVAVENGMEQIRGELQQLKDDRTRKEMAPKGDA